MFSWFRKKDPIEALQKQYDRLLEEARDIRRQGNVVKAGDKEVEAEAIALEIERLVREREANKGG